MGYTSVHHRHYGKPAKLETFSRNLLVGLNTIFVIFGFILFVYGIGGKTSTNRNAYVDITENGGDIFQFTSNVLIILGVVSVFLGLWGLSGIHTYCKAVIYMTLLVLMIFAHLFWSVYSTSMEANAKIEVENNLLSSLEKLKTSSVNPNSTLMLTRQSWDALQSELKCCGVYEYRDWYLPTVLHRIDDDILLSSGDDGVEQVDDTTSASTTSTTTTSTTTTTTEAGNHYTSSEDFFRIPQSCFKNGDDGMADADYNSPVSPEYILENVFKDGCLDKTVIDLDIDRMQRVGILMAFFKILAVISSMIVTCHLRHDKIDFNYV